MEERVRFLTALDLPVPEWKQKEPGFRELVRRAEWESLETQAIALQEQIAGNAAGAFDERRRALADRGDRLGQFGTPLPEDALPLLERAQKPMPQGPWTDEIEPAFKLAEAIRTAENDLSSLLRARAAGVAEWSGEEGERLAHLDARFRAALEPVHQGRAPEAIARLNDVVANELPKAKERREAARSAGTALVAAGRDLSVSTSPLEAALRADAEAPPTTWDQTVPAVEEQNAQIAEHLRERVHATIESLRATLESLREHGVDPANQLVTIEQALGEVATAGPGELAALLDRTRTVTEEPVVAIVASLLDEVRPRLVEARRLGRDPSDVFAAMNRAREALRLRIYSEALAASQEAIERVSQLTEDLDSARDEAENLQALLVRLSAARFPTQVFEANVEKALGLLERVELASAKKLLQETVRTLGREAFTHFSLEQISLDKIAVQAKERGFLPEGTEEEVLRARTFLEDGRLAEAAALLATLEVKLRTAAGPYVARRVEEIERGFQEIPDDALVGPVRKMLADTDVNLRVKGDLAGCLDSLRRAEREFSAVFAAQASSLVEGLEDERRALETMGGAGDEIQRQIDEVQQIFNMGDFVKASRASQEIRTRAQQQQLVRSEDAVSHAKLALVELGKMGLETAALRRSLESAQNAAHAQKYPEAYRLASETQEGAQKLRTSAQSVLDQLAETTDLWQTLRQAGLSVDPLRERIAEAKRSYQALEFEVARSTLTELSAKLSEARDHAEAKRYLAECELLTEDARRLSVPTEQFTPRAAAAGELLSGGIPAQALTAARALHAEIEQHLRPVLEENLRLLTQDLEVARSAGVEAPLVLEALGEARRRLGSPVPTGVAELLESARSQLIETKGFLEHAEKAARRAQEALSQAELVRVDVKAARVSMEKVEVLLAQRQYPRVIELAATLERELGQGTYQQVSKTLAGFQGMIVRARKDGSDTTLAENLLNQGRAALNDGKPLEALQLAARSEGELERVELQTQIALGSLETVEGKHGSAVQHGILAPAAVRELDRAREAYRRKEYPSVLEFAIAASDLLAVARENHRRARDALDAADRQVKEALELGADITEVLKTLERARHHSETGEYLDAVKKAREAAEMALWSIERLYTGALQDVRLLFETANQSGVTEGLQTLRLPLDDAETALKSREWKRAGESLTAARDAGYKALDALVRSRLSELDALQREREGVSTQEGEFRRQAAERVEADRQARRYGAALQGIEEERARLSDRRRQDLQHLVGELKDRVWVGEKLGLDTTPVMELLTEAKLAIEASRLEAVPGLVEKADRDLAALVEGRLKERLREVHAELNFAQDGLHVTVGRIPEQLRSVEERRAEGKVIDAGRALLAAEEELNQRKAMHRELLNIHYLIDAALARATERRLDASGARKLLDESVRARATDYAAALERAREALAMLQGQLKGQEAPASSFWPFKRAGANP